MDNYAGNPDTAPATIRIPANDDEPSFTIFRAGLVDLADRTADTNRRLALALAPDPSIVSIFSGMPDNTPMAAASWVLAKTEAPNTIGWVQNTKVDVLDLFFPLHIPSGWRATEVIITLNGAGGGTTHTGDIPDTMPEAVVFRIDNSGTFTAVSSAAGDPSADLTAYEVVHQFSVPGPIVGNSDKQFFLRIKGEADTHAEAFALKILAVDVVLEPVP